MKKTQNKFTTSGMERAAAQVMHEGAGLSRALGWLFIGFITIVITLATCGCASLQAIVSDADAQALFDKALAKLEQRLDKPPTPTPTPTPTDPTPTPTPPSNALDEVDYSALVWSNGGFSGKGARLDPVARITNLTFSKAALAYRWAGGGCEALGAKSAGDSDATICAVFFRQADGTWRGGKFDWISTSRTSREMKHINGSKPYHNWDASIIPNPADACFVIVSVRTGTRTNVIKSIWRR